MDTARTARLATQRLVLRPLGPDDGDALHALLVQPGVQRGEASERRTANCRQWASRMDTLITVCTVFSRQFF